MNWQELLKSKTAWTAIGSIVGVIGAAAQGGMTWGQTVMPVLTALIGLFLKDALVTQTKDLAK